MLDADGDSDEILSKREPSPDILGHGEMRHGPRLFDQALDAAQRLGEDKDFEVREQVLCNLTIRDTEAECPAVA